MSSFMLGLLLLGIARDLHVPAPACPAYWVGGGVDGSITACTACTEAHVPQWSSAYDVVMPEHAIQVSIDRACMSNSNVHMA